MTSKCKAITCIPLDDRPCNCQFMQRLAAFRGVSVRFPRRAWLGSLHRAGQCQKIWHNLKYYDAPFSIVALDMLLWGGLVASRRAEALACERINWNIEEVMRWCKYSRTMAYSTIMRVPPTQTTAEQVRWAERLSELSLRIGDKFKHLIDLRREILDDSATWHSLLGDIPESAWEEYWQQRKRKHQINVDIIVQWMHHRLDDSLLFFCYDDSKTRGINILEGEELATVFEDRANVALTTGTDEVSQLLLCRVLAPGEKLGLVWLDSAAPKITTPYEDVCLEEVVRRQGYVANCTLLFGADAKKCAKQLWIWSPYRSGPRECSQQGEVCEPLDKKRQNFLDKLEVALSQGRKIVLVDLAYANGGDMRLMKALIERKMLGKLGGYSAWNTAGNSLGTALAILALWPERETVKSRTALTRFLLERIIDDYYYQAIWRAQLGEKYGPPFTCLTPEQVREAQEFLDERVQAVWEDVLADAFPQWSLKKASIRLPWERLFECEVDMKIAHQKCFT